jgi:hypothetical protein
VAFDVLALAEGVVADIRGALTLVGINQRVLAPTILPFVIKQRLVVVISDEIPESKGSEFGQAPDGVVSIQVFDPAGEDIFLAREVIKLPAEKKWEDLPLVVNMIMDVDVRGASYGVYLIEVTYTPADSVEVTRRFPIYVVEPRVAMSTGTGPDKAFDNEHLASTSLPSPSS